jgi:hypothetical protein
MYSQKENLPAVHISA